MMKPIVKTGELDQKTLDDLIRRIVEVAQPQNIILFGSAARGGMGYQQRCRLPHHQRGSRGVRPYGSDL